MIDTSKPVIIRYRIDWRQQCVMFLGGSMFTAIGVCMILSGVKAGWLMTGLWALIPGICLLRLLPNCAFVRVSSNGVELREWFRSVLFPWEQIETFEYVFPPDDYTELVLVDSGPDAGERIPIPPVYNALPLTLANMLKDWKTAVTAQKCG